MRVKLSIIDDNGIEFEGEIELNRKEDGPPAPRGFTKNPPDPKPIKVKEAPAPKPTKIKILSSKENPAGCGCEGGCDCNSKKSCLVRNCECAGCECGRAPRIG